MARTKRRRFAQLDTLDNVVDWQRCEPDWFDQAFGLKYQSLLELGCGDGEHTLALARSRPDASVLGVDRNGARLWKGARKALDTGLTNALFLRSLIEYLEDHIPPHRVAEIWIHFPDPLPKKRQARHRLVSPQFLERYRRLLCPGGSIHLKTDDLDVVDCAERAVRAGGGRVFDGADTPAGAEMSTVQSTYEKRYRDEGRTIHARMFRLD